MSKTHQGLMVNKTGGVRILGGGISPFNRHNGKNENRVLGEDSKKKECFECHGYGHIAFEYVTRLNKIKQ